MIIDHLDNAASYKGCHKKLNLIFRYLKENAAWLKTQPAGPVALPEWMEGIAMKIVEFQSVEGDRKWESHIKNAFLYYMLEGGERTGYASTHCMHDGKKTEGKDQIVWQGDGDRIRFLPGHFLILFPQDAHMSKLAIEHSAPAKKCSFKFTYLEEE